jgi:glycosyltransferase involved in cell wall biosynthesis
VLYTGSFKEDRGIELIVAAALRLPELFFCIVGGEQREADRLRGMALRLGASNVKFVSRVPHGEIPRWQSAADILLMMWTWNVPTIRVCSPMKLFEYMAAERLIVGPAFPTIKEVLADGKDAILFEPDSVDAMVSALQEALLRLDDAALPRAARAKALARYTWQKRCELILNSLPLKRENQ